MTRILVVEDSPTQAEQLRSTLAEADFSVVIASDAEQALEIHDRQQVDIVVSDIMLPRASGFDLCSELKRRNTRLPVLMLSSLNDPMTIIRSLESGADYFLTKPYGPEHLVARIRTALSTSRAREVRGEDGAVEVIFRGKSFRIHSEKEQILDLLLSTFEDIIRTNEELERNRVELARAKRELERHAEHLEVLVDERTAQLMERQKQLATAQKIARLGDWQLDVSSWTVTRSHAMCSVIGTSLMREDFNQALARVHEQDSDRVRQAVTRAIREKSGFSFEARLLQADGSYRHIWFIGEPKTSPSGSIERFYGTAQDLSERKAIEKELLDAREQLYIAQKLEAVGQLTGGMSHDFNNLLAIIIGNLDLAREHVSDPEILASIDQALDAAVRGAELNKRLLAFAKRQALQPEPVDVNNLTSETAKLLRHVLGERVKLKLDLAADLHPAFVDPSQLESAITNLAINARDAMPQGGPIIIRTRNELVTEAAPAGVALDGGDYVLIEVRDCGTGIEPDLLARVCEPFFTTKDVGKGSGLGLSMVSGFLEQSGGALGIDSVPAEGTTMRLYLPRASVADPGQRDDPDLSASSTSSSATILVVEDNEKLRSILVKQLQSLGYETIETASGDEALEVIVANRHFDLLLTDVVMPGRIDGNQLVREARRLRPGLGIVVSSGFRDGTATKDSGLGPVVTLSKPYKKAALAKVIANVLAQAPAKS